MSKESDREVETLQHIVEEGERQHVKISFRAFDDMMASEWTRRKAEG